jgi:Calcineurin-like phosphoesterase
MTTAVVSDLHLGDRTSLVAAPHPRRRLIDQLSQADQVVLLGDMLSLREAPARQVLDSAGPFLAELGEALRGRRVVIVPGNHDHQLVQPLLERRRLDGAGALGLEWLTEPGDAGLIGEVARRLGPAEVVIAYPGLWLRPDVYATHGHYLDCHMTVPRLECVGAALMEAWAGRLPEGALAPGDYEAILAPMYALAYTRAQTGSPNGGGRPAAARRRLTTQTWRWLEDRPGPRTPQWALAGAVARGALAAANRAGWRRFNADLSLAELGRAGPRAMAEVVGRLRIDAAHVIFGHIHRSGPAGGEEGWALPGGAHLLNTGSWVWAPALIGDATRDSPYWPGTCVLVGPEGRPQLRGLLDELRTLPAVP